MPVRLQRIFPSGETSPCTYVNAGMTFAFTTENNDSGTNLLLIDCANDDSKATVYLAEGVEIPQDQTEKMEFLNGQKARQNFKEMLRGASFPAVIELDDVDDGPFQLDISHYSYPKPPV